MEQMTATKLAEQIMERQGGNGSFKQTRWLASLVIAHEKAGNEVNTIQDGGNYIDILKLVDGGWIQVATSKMSGCCKISKYNENGERI